LLRRDIDSKFVNLTKLQIATLTASRVGATSPSAC
jgi:hypothetical protein